jgi:hypothetical protein
MVRVENGVVKPWTLLALMAARASALAVVARFYLRANGFDGSP